MQYKTTNKEKRKQKRSSQLFQASLRLFRREKNTRNGRSDDIPNIQCRMSCYIKIHVKNRDRFEIKIPQKKTGKQPSGRWKSDMICSNGIAHQIQILGLTLSAAKISHATCSPVRSTNEQSQLVFTQGENHDLLRVTTAWVYQS